MLLLSLNNEDYEIGLLLLVRIKWFENEKMFFLDFGSDKVRRVSYASSFGTKEWAHPEILKDIKHLLQNFDFVGCREGSGVSLLKNLFSIHAILNLDPTLLFDQYPELTDTLLLKHTLVYYPLDYDPELETYAQTVAFKLGLVLVNNKQTTYLFGKIMWDRVGIEEWVRNIAESQFVITRSFHGLAFSILYRKPFAIIANKNNRETRIQNLLQQIGLSDRYFTSIQECEEARPWDVHVDYKEVHKKLALLRKSSFEFLKIALS